jgi:hypothetical protein
MIMKANEFKKKYGYTPPYWELINLARKTKPRSGGAEKGPSDHLNEEN